MTSSARRLVLFVAVVTMAGGCHVGDERGGSYVINATSDSFRVRYMDGQTVGFVYDLPPGAIGRAPEVTFPRGIRLEVLSPECAVLGSISLEAGVNYTAVVAGGHPERRTALDIPDGSNESLLILGDTCGSSPSGSP